MYICRKSKSFRYSEVSVGLGRRCGNSRVPRLSRTYVCVEIGVRVRALHSDTARSEDVCRGMSEDMGEMWRGTKVSVVLCMLYGEGEVGVAVGGSDGGGR